MSRASDRTITTAPTATPPISRRRLLVGSGLAAIAADVGLPAMAVAATSITSPDHPDATLIRTCAEHIVNMHTYNRDGGLGPRDAPDPLWDAYERTRAAISEAKPRTLAGMQAKARAAKAEAMASRTDGEESPEGTPAEQWAWHLVNDLLAGSAVA